METWTTTMEDRKRKNFEDYKPLEIRVLKSEIEELQEKGETVMKFS